MSWVGGWSDLTRYRPDDGVDHLGSSYIAVGTPVLGLAPPSPDWQLIASIGATGAEGPKGDTGATALIHAETFAASGLTDGKVVAALFRIRNTTSAPITWTPTVRVSAYGGWGEQASVALAIPANRTSTAIFVSTGGPQANAYTRSIILAFISNSLNLPAGLQFVDDLDTATGGGTQ